MSSDSFSGVLSTKLLNDISFPLISDVDTKLLKSLGLDNLNMNRSPTILILGKNMAKYWVYEGVSVSDRPSVENILAEGARISQIYK